MSVKKEVQRIGYLKLWYALPIIAALGLCVAMFRGGAQLYWGPVESDLINSFYPWRTFTHRWFTRGVFPYWDPHIFSGYPSVETQQLLNLNPLHLAGMWLPPGLGLIVFTALNTIIACAGMMWGLRRCAGCSPMASALGGGLYAFSGLFAIRIMAGHLTVVSALAWWPVAVLPVLRLIRMVPSAVRRRQDATVTTELNSIKRCLSALWQAGSFRRCLAISAAAHAMVCLAGAPQYIVYLFYMDMAVLVAVARRWNYTGALTATAIVWVLALVISAPQWVPAFWYLPYSGRALSQGGMGGINFSPMLNIWLEMLMPFPFGDDLSHGHLHFKNVWETATYPGGLTIILTIALATRAAGWLWGRLVKRQLQVAPISPVGLAGLLILIAGFYLMVGGWFPGFSGFREPLKARALVAFGFAISAAAAFDATVLRYSRWNRSLWVAIALVLFMLTVATTYSDPARFREIIESFGGPMAASNNDYEEALKDPIHAIKRFRLAYLGAALGACVAVLCFWPLRRNRQAATVLFFLFTAGDPLAQHARAWLARHPWSAVELPDATAAFFKEKLEATRGQLPWRVVLHSGIINRTHHMDGLYEFYGYDPLMPAHAVNRMLLKGVMERTGESDKSALRVKLLEAAGARYDAKEWWPAPHLGGTTEPKVLESPAAALFDISRSVVAGSPGPNVFGPDLQGRHYVLPAERGGRTDELPEVPQDFAREIQQLFPPRDAEDTTASRLATGESLQPVETGRPDEYAVRVTLQSPALIVYKGTWLPGWRAYIDGLDQGRTLFANNWMAGVIVPAGAHEVLFRYRPVAWWPSVLASAVGVFVLIGLIVMNGRRRNIRTDSA